MAALPSPEPIQAHSLPVPLPSTAATNASTSSTTAPNRPKHLTTRSITEVNAPPSLPRIPHYHGHGHSRKHSHHQPHMHHHRHKDKGGRHSNGRDGGGEGAGAGGSRGEGHTPSESTAVSLRGSTWGEDGVGSRGVYGSGGRRERLVKEGEVRGERERGVLRATELRNALNALNKHSNLTTRRLDMTYYSVLEKLSILQNTISSLKELAHLTRGLTEEFSTEAQAVVDDVTGQVDGFDSFREQEGRIKGLKERVKAGRQRIQVLGSRVDAVRERVEGWEVAEREWQDRTRRRLRVVWVGMSLIVGLVLVLVAVQYTPVRTVGGEGNGMKGLNVTGLLGVIPDMQGLREGSENWSSPRKGLGEGVLEKLREGERAGIEGEDPRMRVFDEL